MSRFANVFLPVSTAVVEGGMVSFTQMMYTTLVVKRPEVVKPPGSVGSGEASGRLPKRERERSGFRHAGVRRHRSTPLFGIGTGSFVCFLLFFSSRFGAFAFAPAFLVCFLLLLLLLPLRLFFCFCLLWFSLVLIMFCFCRWSPFHGFRWKEHLFPKASPMLGFSFSR